MYYVRYILEGHTYTIGPYPLEEAAIKAAELCERGVIAWVGEREG